VPRGCEDGALQARIERNGHGPMLGLPAHTKESRTMDERESDPTGAFSGGGAAGIETTELERQAPGGGQPGGSHNGGSRPNNGKPSTRDGRVDRDPSLEVDEDERDVVTSGTAATSEIADPEAQSKAGFRPGSEGAGGS
jgi:hypothetical protein